MQEFLSQLHDRKQNTTLVWSKWNLFTWNGQIRRAILSNTNFESRNLTVQCNGRNELQSGLVFTVENIMMGALCKRGNMQTGVYLYRFGVVSGWWSVSYLSYPWTSVCENWQWSRFLDVYSICKIIFCMFMHYCVNLYLGPEIQGFVIGDN